MSHALTPEQAIALIPDWRHADVFVEGALGGLTNRSFRVRYGTDQFVLRLDAAHTSTLRLDRAAEQIAIERAYAAGIGAELVYSDPERGILVTRYVPGRSLVQADLADASVLEAVAALLRRLHALPELGTGFDIQKTANGYLASLPDDSDMRRGGEVLVTMIDAQVSTAPTSFCHNDVIAANFIHPGPNADSLVLIDWEYAGDNDAYFDLASLIAYNQLDARSMDTLLGAYFGEVASVDRARLAAQIRNYNALYWLWLAACEAVKPSVAQRETLEQLRKAIESPSSG